MLSYRKRIEDRINLNQGSGQPFAFMINEADNSQIWISLNFLFYSFEPELKCHYFIQKQRVYNRQITLLEELTFDNLEVLIKYLMENEVDSECCRAIH